MKPNYPKLRTVSKTTYFFLSSTSVSNFLWVLEHIYQAKNFIKYSHNQIKDVIPTEISIPTVVSVPTDGADRIAKRICLIVSQYDTDDLHDILCHTFYDTFDELTKMRRNRNNNSKEIYLKNRKYDS